MISDHLLLHSEHYVMYSGPKTKIRTCEAHVHRTGTDSTSAAPDVRSTYRNNKEALRPPRHVRLGRETVTCVEHVHTVSLCVDVVARAACSIVRACRCIWRQIDIVSSHPSHKLELRETHISGFQLCSLRRANTR